MDDGGGDALIEAFREQVRWCDKLGSPFTRAAARWLADDWLAGGHYARCCPRGAPARRGRIWCRCAWPARAACAGALGPASELAAAYPPAPRPSMRKCWAAPALSAGRRSGQLRATLASAPQTNEVMRSAVLIGGYAAIAEATRLPLACARSAPAPGSTCCGIASTTRWARADLGRCGQPGASRPTGAARHPLSPAAHRRGRAAQQ